MNGRAEVVAFVEPVQGEVHNHNPVLLHNAHEKEETDDGVKRKRRIKQPQRKQSPDDGRKEGRKHRNRVHITLVENPENDVHDENRGEDKERQRPEKLLEHQAFSLHLAFHRRRQNFRGGLLDEISHVTERHAGFRIETECDAGELIQVIDPLQPQFRSRFRQGADRDHRVFAIGPDVQLA